MLFSLDIFEVDHLKYLTLIPLVKKPMTSWILDYFQFLTYWITKKNQIELAFVAFYYTLSEKNYISLKWFYYQFLARLCYSNPYLGLLE